MYLKSLNNEQKILFLDLALAAATANNIVEEAEAALLKEYAEEMSITANPNSNSNMSVEEICERLKEISNSKELNEISFEIVGMIMSDNIYDDDEKMFISKMAEIFEIPMSRINEMFNYVKEYMELIKKITILMYE